MALVDAQGTAYSTVVSSLETMPTDAVYVLPESVGAMKGEAYDGILMSLGKVVLPCVPSLGSGLHDSFGEL